MNWNSNFRVAIKAIRINKMRSILTSLGIIIGIMSVIIMLAISEGASQNLSKQISSLGSNLLIIQPGSVKAGIRQMGSGSNTTLKYSDGTVIKKEINSVIALSSVMRGNSQVVYRNQNWLTSITGVDPEYLTIQKWTIILGRVFNEKENITSAKVCLIGQTVLENLFGDLDPIGETIRIKGIPFKIIGVLGEKGQSMRGSDEDDVIIIPIRTAQKRIFGMDFPDMVHMITVQIISEDKIPDAEKRIEELLKQRHRIKANQENDFSIRNLGEILKTAQNITKIMSLLLVSIASISLIVGGIGIMNIMLVSVSERTREIGVRMAVGAKPLDIQLQFLTEALILCLFGGLIGVVLGIGASHLLAFLFKDLHIKISIFSIILSFGFSATIGVIFGFYPAFKASKLNPIDALRRE